MWSYLEVILCFSILFCSASVPQASFDLHDLRAPHEDGRDGGQPLDFTSSAPHIFASVRDLLQQWPNTFAPNGHSVVPAVIPAFTTLYHGRMDEFAPGSPEWLALDPDMSYGIMGSGRASHLLTYQTTKPVNLIYFDGLSGVLAGEGRTDTQMALAFGNLTGPRPQKSFLDGDLIRSHGLCGWLREQGLAGPDGRYEGFMRMAVGFEIIWCNMSSPALRLLSYLNATVPLNRAPLDVTDAPPRIVDRRAEPRPFPLPSPTLSKGPVYDPLGPTQTPDWTTIAREPFQWSEIWQWYTSMTWHYGRSGAGPGRGEERVKPAACHFQTYYSPSLQGLQESRAADERARLNLTRDGHWHGVRGGERQVALQQLARRRRRHTLAELHATDAAAFRQATARALRADEACSGVDWHLLANTIAQAYTDRLDQLRRILVQWHVAADSTSRYWHDVAREHTHIMLLQYLEYLSLGESEQLEPASPRGQGAYARCKYSYTRLLSSDQHTALNENEALLKWAVEETLGGICAGLLEVGLGVEREWRRRDAANTWNGIPEDLSTWLQRTEELIAWLGWTGDHVQCPETCQWNEICKCLTQVAKPRK